MEMVPVATTDTVGIKGRKTHQLIVNLSGNGKSMPGLLENGTKIRFMVKKDP